MTGADVKALRTKLGLTQRAFGEQISYSMQTVAHWEAGRQPVGPKAKLAIESLSLERGGELTPIPRLTNPDKPAKLVAKTRRALELGDIGSAVQLLALLQEKLCG